MVDGSPQLLPETLAQLRLAHLNMIQGVIGRMSSFSANVKNFAATISAGIIALAFQQHAQGLLPFAAAFILIFGWLDAYYLGLEREFRKFYAQTASRPLSDAADVHIRANSKGHYASLRALGGFSILGFYAPFFIVICVLIWFSPRCP